MFLPTTALHKILSLTKRLKIIQGGTSAGKTIAILLVLIDKAQSTQNKIISVVSESMPHLRRGAVRDFLSIMEAQGYFKEKNWNRTDLIYTFETGSKIEFFSADQPGKVRGPRRNTLFANECNNINFETWTQLVIRTDEDIYADFNPVSSFWIHEQVIPKQDHDFLILTYKDNESLAETIVKEIESRRDNKYFWRVYGEGLIGEIEGMIYKDWAIVDDVPHEARLIRRGLDFGYTNDPSSLIDVYEYNNGYIFDEITYTKGLSNKQIADTIMGTPQQGLVIADSAEPKSIDELKAYGVNVLPCTKGAGSVLRGIQYVQAQRCSVTKRSVNTIKEYRNYIWLTDKDGVIINEEDPRNANHSMSAIRYALDSLRPNESAMRQVMQKTFRVNEANFHNQSTR